MARAYSEDLRRRIIGTVKTGAPCRQARHHGIGESTAFRWVSRWRRTGTPARPQGGEPRSHRSACRAGPGGAGHRGEITLAELAGHVRARRAPGSPSDLLAVLPPPRDQGEKRRAVGGRRQAWRSITGGRAHPSAARGRLIRPWLATCFGETMSILDPDSRARAAADGLGVKINGDLARLAHGRSLHLGRIACSAATVPSMRMCAG